MDAIYVIGIVVLGVLAIALGVKQYLSRINGEKIEQGVDKAIEIAKSFLDIVDLGKTEKNIVLILDVASDVVDFVVSMSYEAEDKVLLSKDAIKHVLDELGIAPSPQEQKLIDIIVEESLKWIENHK